MRETDERDGKNNNIEKTLSAAKYVFAALCLATGSAGAASIIIVCYFISNVLNDRYYKSFYTSANTVTDFLLGNGLFYIMAALIAVLAISGISGLIVYHSAKEDISEDPRKGVPRKSTDSFERRGAIDASYTYIRRCHERAHGSGWLAFLIVIGCVYAAASILSVIFIGDRMRTAAHVRWSVTASRIESDLGLQNASYEITDPDNAAENYCTVTFKNASEDGALSFTTEINLDGKIGQEDGLDTICRIDFRYEPDEDFTDEVFTSGDSAITRVLEALQTDRTLFEFPELMDNIPELPFSIISRVKNEETISYDNGCRAEYGFYGKFLELAYGKTVTDSGK